MRRFSIIICTYNRESYINTVSNCIINQDFPKSDFELIFIDNNSTDNTENIINKFIDENHTELSIKYFKEYQQGISFARNKGIEVSSGEIIIFIDDDETIENNYLIAVDQFFKEYKHIKTCGGPVIPYYETDKPNWISHFTEELVTGALYRGNKIKPFPKNKFPGAGNSAYRKEFFTQYGVFNTNLGRNGSNPAAGEEKDIFFRLTNNGEQVYYVPQMIIYHHIPAKKLTDSYFKNLTYLLGKSERLRTLSISHKLYYKRIFSECIKWCASVVLFLYYLLILSPQKGAKLVEFRYNVTKGLLGK